MFSESILGFIEVTQTDWFMNEFTMIFAVLVGAEGTAADCLLEHVGRVPAAGGVPRGVLPAVEERQEVGCVAGQCLYSQQSWAVAGQGSIQLFLLLFLISETFQNYKSLNYTTQTF